MEPSSSSQGSQLPPILGRSIRMGVTLTSKKPVRLLHKGKLMTRKQDAAASKALAPFYGVVGQICSSWALFEQQLDDVVWTLAEIRHDYGACITSQVQSSEYRLRALLALAKQRGASEPLVKRINTFIRDCQGYTTKRNRIVHDPLLYNVTVGYVAASRLSANKTLIYELQQLDFAEFKAEALDINRFKNTFHDLSEAIYAEVLPSPKTIKAKPSAQRRRPSSAKPSSVGDE